jgi:hypothetical protein
VKVAEADSRFRVITEGVNEGDELILFPGNGIADGVRVKAREKASSG